MIPAPHLNEHLKRILPAVAKAGPQKVTQATHTPYLILDARLGEGVTKQDLDALRLMDDAGLVRSPFPMFRFCIESTKGKLFGFCERTERALALVALHKQEDGMGPIVWACTFKGSVGDKLAYDGRIYDQHTLADLTDSVDAARDDNAGELYKEAIEDPEAFANSIPADRRAEESRKIVKHLRQVAARHDTAIAALKGQINVLETIQTMMAKQTDDILGLPKEHFETFMAIYGMVMLLCYEYFVPHNFLAKVAPDKPGKSVEWRQAREHYTIVHRHHPANNSNVVEGSHVPNNGHMLRVAHTRRAHTKLLTHPRWKNSIGKRVFVRATWVGPKEWKDTAGQTYTIVPSHEQPAIPS